MSCNESLKLMDAYADGELDLKSVIAVERHIAECAGCNHALLSIRALKQSMKSGHLYYRASDTLGTKVASAVVKEGGVKLESNNVRRSKTISMSWPAFGLALASVAVASLTLALQLGRPSRDAVLSEEIAASHVRSLMEGHLEDVVSTDQHTVKPWFAGRLDYSPPVADFNQQGFSLAGGRLDYVDHRSVATLIYRHNKHVINVYVWPEQDAGAARSWSRDGFNIIKRNSAGMTYWVISDLNAQALESFSQLLQ